MESAASIGMQMPRRPAAAEPPPPQGPPPRRIMRLLPACEYAQIGRTKMYDLIRTGKIMAVKEGRATLIDLDSVDRHLASLPALQLRQQLQNREADIKHRNSEQRKRK